VLVALEIRNLRGARHCKIDRFNKINLFVGRYGSGKSTILESVYLAKLPANSSEVLRRVLGRRTGRPVDLRDLWYRYDVSSRVELTWTFDNTRTLTVQVGTGADNGMAPNQAGILYSSRQNNANTSDRLPEDWGLTSYSVRQQFLDNFTSSIALVDMKELESAADTEGTFLNPLKEKNLDTSLLEELGKVYGDIGGYEFLRHSPRSPTDFRASIQMSDARVFMDDLPDGLRAGIVMLSKVFGLSNTAILFEEPETHQYSGALSALIRSLCDLSRRNNLQLFVTTHRPEVLADFVKHGEKDVTIFRVERIEGEIVTTTSEWNDLKILQDLGFDVGLLARGFEKFVIVDGLMDKAILESCVKKSAGVDSEDLLITILPSRGKKQMKEIIKAIFGIKREIFVLPDRDTLTSSTAKQSIIDAAKSLQNEGYSVTEEGSILKLAKGGFSAGLNIDNIIPLGVDLFINEKAIKLSTHSIDDYVLEVFIQNPKIAKAHGLDTEKLHEVLASASSSKQVLAEIFEYNPESVLPILRDLPVPESLKGIVQRLIQ
jgi:AAA15 family ATPase/GTPase